MPEDIKRMNIKEFRELGFLQEANRQFFHPVGLALEVIIEEDGSESLGGVWDYRNDPEGLFFGSSVMSQDKIDYVTNLKKSKHTSRFFAARDNGFKIDSKGLQVINDGRERKDVGDVQ